MQKLSLADNYRQVMSRVGEAAARSGRQAADVVVVAVTKTAGLDQIRQILDLGHQDLGESRVQQLQQRAAMTAEFLARRRMMDGQRASPLPREVRWHMIGHLQRNKVKPIVPVVRLIHSVDSLRLAEELQACATRMERDVDLLLQVNAAEEPQKFGLSLPAVMHLADQIETMLHLRIRGLMAMAPQSDNPESSRSVFQRVAELFQEMKATGRYGPHFNLLSMGMSEDYEIGIECGANLVRVGRAIFGDGPALLED